MGGETIFTLRSVIVFCFFVGFVVFRPDTDQVQVRLIAVSALFSFALLRQYGCVS